LSDAQCGFETELPYPKLNLDTPYTFEKLDDFYEIELDKNGNPDTVLQCTVNDQGNEVLRIAKGNSPDKSLYHRGIRKYDTTGLLISYESNYPNLNEYNKLFYTYNNKNQLTKVSLFSLKSIRKLKPNHIPIKKDPSLGFMISGDDNDTNFYDSKEWTQENIWIFKYNEKGNILEYYQNDQFNQTNRIVCYYDKKDKIIYKENYEGRCGNISGRDGETLDTTNSYQEWLTVRDTFIYLKGGYCINSNYYKLDYPFSQIIDSVCTDSKNRILSEKWYRRPFAEDNPDKVFELVYSGGMKIEYDKYNRKSNQTSYSEHGEMTDYIYFYRKSSKTNLTTEGFQIPYGFFSSLF